MSRNTITKTQDFAAELKNTMRELAAEELKAVSGAGEELDGSLADVW